MPSSLSCILHIIKTMKTCNLNITFTTFHFLLFSLFISNIILIANSQQFSSDSLLGGTDPCANVTCGQGKCYATNATLLGFDCQCNPGWKKIQIDFQFLNITLPACTVPDCTLNFQCGNGSPPTPPPPPPPLPSPCALVWCGDGTCAVNGTGYYCQCNEGASNFLNMPGAACLAQCVLGADCNGVSLGQSPSPTSGSPGNAAPPPANTTVSGTNSMAEPPSSDSGRMGIGLGLVAGLGLFCMGLLS